MPLFDQLKQYLAAPVGGQQVQPLSGLGAGFQAPQYVDPKTQASFEALQNQYSNQYQQINAPKTRGQALGTALLGTLLMGPAGAFVLNQAQNTNRQKQTNNLQQQYLDTLKTFGYTANQLNPVNQSGIDNRFGASTLNNAIDVYRGLNNTGVSENVAANLKAANAFGQAPKQQQASPLAVHQRQGNTQPQDGMTLQQGAFATGETPTFSAGVEQVQQKPYGGARFDENVPISSEMLKALLQGTTATISNASGSAPENTRAITGGALDRAKIGTEGTEQQLNQAKVGTEGARQGLYGAEAYRANELGRYVAPQAQARIRQMQSAAGLNSANAALAGTRASEIRELLPYKRENYNAKKADLLARAGKGNNAGKDLEAVTKVGIVKGYIDKKTGALKPPPDTVGGIMGFGATPNPKAQEYNAFVQVYGQVAGEAVPELKQLAPLPAQPKFKTGASYAQSVLGGR